MAFITAIKGQDLTIDITEILPGNAIDYVFGYGELSLQLPSWATLTESINVNTLNFPLNILDDIYSYSYWLVNNTDYINQIKININAIGSYQLRLKRFKIYTGVLPPNTPPIGQSTEIINITVVEPPPVIPNEPQGIQYNTYDRVLRVEKNTIKEISFGTDGLYPNGEQLIITSTLPAWITNNTINNFTQFWSLAPTSVGTYYYYANVYLRQEYKGVAIITVIVVESLYEEIDNCCSDENVNIVWLNRQGGRGNYIFTQRKDFNVEVGKKSTYITNDIKRYSEIKNVHNGFKVYATGISKNQIDFIDTLRYSIQCWQFINGVFVPLILDIGSFEKYNTKENMYEISMNFLYAERLNIQRQ